MEKEQELRTNQMNMSFFANMTSGAWNGNHQEFYEYDDSPLCYEEFEKDFDLAWANSQEIPYNIIVAKNLDNLVEGNPIIKKAKKIEKVILATPKVEQETIKNIQYVIDYEKIKDQYKGLVKDVKVKDKNGMVEIIPKVVDVIEHNYKKERAKNYNVENIKEGYPELTMDFVNEKVFLNEEEMNLTPTEEEIKKDISNLIDIFNNFNLFIGNTEKLKQSHFKALNAIFSSPFNAKIRCTAKLRGFSTSSLPLYLLVASSTANCGKTFMLSAILKMMTGMELPPQINDKDLTKSKIFDLQKYNKGVPVFIDEMDGRTFGNIKDLIKNPERCEDSQNETMPMLIFASNNILEPDEILRKRMVFLRLDGRLPSNIDQSAYKSKGNAIIRRLGTGLYREYLRRMMNKVATEIDYIISDKNIPDEYYPDLMKLSSDTIIEIFNDYGFDIPNYIWHLTWEDDYSVNAKFVSEDAISAIENIYLKNKKAFSFKNDKIIIEIGLGSNTKKECESWMNTLPSEIEAEAFYLKNSVKISLDRKEFEKRIGYKLKNNFLSKFFNY